MRLLAAMESSGRYKEMALPEKVLLMRSMLRAGNLKSVSARSGTISAYNIFTGIGYNVIDAVLDAKVVGGNRAGEKLTNEECNALAKKLKIPEQILSGDSASAFRTALGAVAPSKIAPKSPNRKQ